MAVMVVVMAEDSSSSSQPECEICYAKFVVAEESVDQRSAEQLGQASLLGSYLTPDCEDFTGEQMMAI